MTERRIFAGYFRDESGPLYTLTLEARIEPAQLAEHGQTIDLGPIPVGSVELAISGEYRRADARYRAFEGGGQCLDALRAVIASDGKAGPPDVARPDLDDLRRILDVWEHWHLNGMRPGCRHQIAEGWKDRPIDPSKPTDTYGRHFNGQRQDSWNMLAWVRPDEHLEGLLTKPCPTCGYAYGSAWLYEPLPADVERDIRRIFGM